MAGLVLKWAITVKTNFSACSNSYTARVWKRLKVWNTASETCAALWDRDLGYTRHSGWTLGFASIGLRLGNTCDGDTALPWRLGDITTGLGLLLGSDVTGNASDFAIYSRIWIVF